MCCAIFSQWSWSTSSRLHVSKVVPQMLRPCSIMFLSSLAYRLTEGFLSGGAGGQLGRFGRLSLLSKYVVCVCRPTAWPTTSSTLAACCKHLPRALCGHARCEQRPRRRMDSTGFFWHAGLGAVGTSRWRCELSSTRSGTPMARRCTSMCARWRRRWRQGSLLCQVLAMPMCGRPEACTWCACVEAHLLSRVSFAAVKGPAGPPLYGEDAARALGEKWSRVYAGSGTSAAQEDRFWVHVPSDQLEAEYFPVDFSSGAGMGRRDSAPGPDGLRRAAWAASGPRFENALNAFLRRAWGRGGLAPRDRVALMCFLPKDAVVEGVMERAASRPISLIRPTDSWRPWPTRVWRPLCTRLWMRSRRASYVVGSALIMCWTWSSSPSPWRPRALGGRPWSLWTWRLRFRACHIHVQRRVDAAAYQLCDSCRGP